MNRFWDWYNRHYALNVTVAASLFALQIVHLVWLTFDPLWRSLFGVSALELERPWSWPLLLVDYTEIPALVSVSLVYLNELRHGLVWRPALYLAFLNTQWLHILWITDEFVVASDGGAAPVGMPAWLAYVAIGIDYLELPVIYDTVRRTVAAVRDGRLGPLLREEAA